MTYDSAPTPSHDSAPPPPPPPAVAQRPGMVTAAGVTLIVLGALTLLVSVILLLGVGLFAGAAGGIPESEVPAGMGGLFGAFAGAIFVIMLIVAGFGVLQLVSGIQVLAGRNWARITGIVVAAIAGLLALLGLGSNEGVVLNIILVAANGFVIWALATTGPWFSARAVR